MHSHNLPKTIQRWIDSNAEKIAEYWTEEDGYGEHHQGGVSVWVYLKRPFINADAETSIIHAATAQDFMSDAGSVQEDREWWLSQYGETK